MPRMGRRSRGGRWSKRGWAEDRGVSIIGVPLLEAPVGSIVEVSYIDAGWGMWQKLAAMGIRPGTKLQILGNDFRGVVVAINNTRYAIGRGMATRIHVRIVSQGLLGGL